MTPTKIGRYEVKGELGRGGMATVYRAYDPSFEREVAIKVLPREFLHDPQFHDRFKREIKTIAALEHPAIVPVYDVGEDDGVPYFVMRYMTGGSLSNWITKGKFSIGDAARIIERISSALAYAHKRGVIHRDLKPDNILFDQNGEPFISDFGVAKFGTSTTNLTGGNVIGTPAYMSPEQAQGEKLDGRSDIYGLGVIIFQMLSGKQPYNADTPMGVVVKHLTEPVPEILKVSPDLPSETDVVIKTAMAKDPEQRYPTATHLSKAFNQVARGEPAAVTGVTPSKGVAPAKAKATAKGGGNRGLVFGIIGIIAALAIAGFLFRGQIMAAVAPAPTATLQPTATAIPPTVQPTDAGPTTVAPTEIVVAPACAPVAVATPDPFELERICTRKNPFTTVSIPLNATIKSLASNPLWTCKLDRVAGDRQIAVCGGIGGDQQVFDAEVCLPAPTPPPPSTGGNCAEGTTYDSANACCAAPVDPAASCTIFRVNLRECQQ